MDEDPFEDNQNGRSGIDRRQFSFTIHIPERRIGRERRIEGQRGLTYNSCL